MSDTNELCTALLNDQNEVCEIIVGNAAWAEKNLGGRWVEFLRNAPGKTYPGYGSVYDPETHDFSPAPCPPPPPLPGA